MCINIFMAVSEFFKNKLNNEDNKFLRQSIENDERKKKQWHFKTFHLFNSKGDNLKVLNY